MSSYGPFIAVALALIAAGSIAVIAWELSSEKFHENQEEEPGNPDDD
jgi:hypothetical protein